MYIHHSSKHRAIPTARMQGFWNQIDTWMKDFSEEVQGLFKPSQETTGNRMGSPASQALWDEDSGVTGDTWTERKESVWLRTRVQLPCRRLCRMYVDAGEWQAPTVRSRTDATNIPMQVKNQHKMSKSTKQNRASDRKPARKRLSDKTARAFCRGVLWEWAFLFF